MMSITKEENVLLVSCAAAVATSCRTTILLLLVSIVCVVGQGRGGVGGFSTSTPAHNNPTTSNKTNEDFFNETLLDCEMRLFALHYARYLHPWKMDSDILFQQVYDALMLKDLCHVSTYQQTLVELPFNGIMGVVLAEKQQQQQQRQFRRMAHTNKKSSNTRSHHDHNPSSPSSTLSTCSCSSLHCVHVYSSGDNSNRQEPTRPLEDVIHLFNHNNSTREYQGICTGTSTLQDALLVSRSINDPYNTTIVLRQGIHSIQTTIHLEAMDSGLTIQGYPTEEVWLSGSIPIPNDIHWDWDCQHGIDIRVTNLTDVLQGYTIPSIVSLFTLDKRLIRARFPNGDPEINQWGYNTPDKLKFSIPPEEVIQWHRPRPGLIPTFVYVDLRQRSEQQPDRPMKNDSTMEYYNVYASGSGGVCADLWGPEAHSYWCSNASDGGWAEVDRECATTGQLQIPIGMDYNRTTTIGQWIDQAGSTLVGGLIHAWHSQSWAMHMFNITSSSSSGTLLFAPGGGSQGGRNWCRCDQCDYAGPWCGQHNNPPNNSDTRLISGTWYIENVFMALDEPGEYYFNHTSQLLYLYPNHTESNPTGLQNIRFSLLSRLIEISNGATNITISGIGFRETAPTYMDDWSPPSGGDWSLHRGGAIYIQNASYIHITNCIFHRLDGNAIFLSQRTRYVYIRRNIFEWLGENAIATWGETNHYDATSRNQPLWTYIEGNVMRELGIYQKQSSAYAHNKAALTVIRNNIMFNMPRAAINFNDMMGGGDLVTRNLIFNTCRESGDHGPINSWDRQPFMTNLVNDTISFQPIRRTISFNFIIANYGASQGVDNDDGSSWFHVVRNVFHTADGFKMDYGGHDSIYEDNLVISYPHKYGQCIDFGSFFPHHGHVVRRNRCLVPYSGADHNTISFLWECTNDEHGHHMNISNLDDLDDKRPSLYDNHYYTPDGTAKVECTDVQPKSIIPLEELQLRFHMEKETSLSKTPPIEQVKSWVVDTLFPDSAMIS